MPRTKTGRARLFSLSERMRRRAATQPEVAVDGAQDVDDDCPVCVAARSGGPVSLDALHEPAFLLKEASRILKGVKLSPGEEVQIMELGHRLADGTFEISRYSVAADGSVYLTRNARRTLVTRLRR